MLFEALHAHKRRTVLDAALGELDTPMRARLRLDARGQVTQWLGGLDNRWHDAAELFRQVKGGRRKSDEEGRRTISGTFPLSVVVGFL
ncbi:hypothetical protein G6321_00043155 [Bradyrhizobium barranii subsp. barranii]|uniref:Uncharacterized protein n=1 Tax=Bradyrhizobium barranii subsp. barranii TaxID=2823807 RepID=A0A7Z0QD05_9BRAD|nr:hypothetical protein [Bradyrhizobium barranii]UGX92431.1 hypothetical protein G6321_00043155 [Bradyrhizobium barranii subsp. barranii]